MSDYAHVLSPGTFGTLTLPNRVIMAPMGTEMGTHEELMAKKGAYYKMFQVQSYYYREQGVAVHA